MSHDQPRQPEPENTQPLDSQSESLNPDPSEPVAPDASLSEPSISESSDASAENGEAKVETSSTVSSPSPTGAERLETEQPETGPSVRSSSAPTPGRSSRSPRRNVSTSSQRVKRLWQDVRPVIKTQAIRALKVTIRSLEKAVDTLESEPQIPPAVPPNAELKPRSVAVPKPQVFPTPAEPDIDSDLWFEDEEPTPTQEPGPEVQPTDAIAPSPRLPTSNTSATPSRPRPASKPQPTMQDQLLERGRLAWEQIRPVLERAIALWNTALTRIRTVLPESLNEKLSNRALSGIVGGVLIFLLWTTSSLFSGKPAEVAITPSVAPTLVPSITAPARPKTPESAPEPKTPEPKTPEPNAPVATPVVTPTPSPAPKVVESPKPPPLNLTPEQSLIAAIQDQVTEITNQYANGLIQSIQANFRESRLIIKVSPDWYGLNHDRQNKLADEMLMRSRELDFTQLEITDADGTLVARNPVVGSTMVILRRTPPDESSTTS